MAEGESEGKGFDLTRKVGPFPLWGWGLGVAAVGFLVISRKTASKAGAGAGSGTPGAGGTFSSTVSHTDPATGEQSTYTATGDNSSIQSPAQLTWGAGPMPYSGGDVYVNYPGGAPQTGPAGPPGPQGPPGTNTPPPVRPPRNPDWGRWETVTNDFGLLDMARKQLGDPGLGDKIWNDPVNKAVHDLRGGPDRLQPGDVVWVFDGWKPGWKAPADFVPYNPDPAHPSPAGPNVVPPRPDPSQN
jgi:hypothetical protein